MYWLVELWASSAVMTLPLNLVALSPFLIGLVANRPRAAPGIEEGLTSHLSRSPEAFAGNGPEAFAGNGVVVVAVGTGGFVSLVMGGGGGDAAPNGLKDLGDPTTEGLAGATDLGDPTREGLGCRTLNICDMIYHNTDIHFLTHGLSF